MKKWILYAWLLSTLPCAAQMQTQQALLIPSSKYWGHSISSTLCAMSASGHKCTLILRIPKTGNITTVGIRTGTVTTSDSLTVGLQTVDGDTGAPSGAAYGGMVAGVQAVVASNIFYPVTLGTPASATGGGVAALVVSFTSYVAGNLYIAGVGTTDTHSFPYMDRYDGAAWTKSVTPIIVTLMYDDGTVENIGPAAYASVLTGTLYNSGSNPDEVALKFRLPFPYRVKGFWAVATASTAGADFDIILYDAADAVLASVSFDGDQVGTTGSGSNFVQVFFNTPQVCQANQWYRLALKPTTASNVRRSQLSVYSAAYMDALEGGQNFIMSTRVNAGVWTDSTTDRPLMGLIIDQLAAGGTGFVVVQ
jgi:hypothetical protein